MKTLTVILPMFLLMFISCRQQQSTAPAIEHAADSQADHQSLIIDPTEWCYDASEGKWKSQYHTVHNGGGQFEVRVITSNLADVVKRKGLIVPEDVLMKGRGIIKTVTETMEIRE